MRNPSDTLFSVVTDALDARNYKYLVLNERTVSLRILDACAAFDVAVTANDANSLVVCYSQFGAFCPIDRRTALAEAITRVNYTLAYGCFEMDFKDGEIRFRVGLDTENSILTITQVDNLVGMSVHACARYHEAFMRIAFGDSEPAAAIAIVQ